MTEDTAGSVMGKKGTWGLLSLAMERGLADNFNLVSGMAGHILRLFYSEKSVSGVKLCKEGVAVT